MLESKKSEKNHNYSRQGAPELSLMAPIKKTVIIDLYSPITFYLLVELQSLEQHFYSTHYLMINFKNNVNDNFSF